MAQHRIFLIIIKFGQRRNNREIILQQCYEVTKPHKTSIARPHANHRNELAARQPEFHPRYCPNG